jgi:hypothetical protein
MRHIKDPSLRREYGRRAWRLWRERRDPGLLQNYLLKCACHYHYWTMSQQMARGAGPIRNSF